MAHSFSGKIDVNGFSLGARADARLRFLNRRMTERTRHLGRQVHATTHGAWNRTARAAGVVSFDVFDTALFRCVTEPADVFEIVGFRLRERGVLDLDPVAFAALRKRAETLARERARDCGRAEVTLEEIHIALQPLLSQTTVAQRLAEELAVEAAVLVANPDVKRAYLELVAAGKTVVFVSDTYFSAAFVAERLEAAGYPAPLRVFASSEHDATKENGTLFDVVARETGTPCRSIVHLGDNRGPDVLMARRHGVRAFWYRPGSSQPRFRDDRSLVERVVSRIETLAVRAAPDERARALASFGTGVMGPIFLGFTQWLALGIARTPTDLVLFCARDGYLVQRIYALFASPGEIAKSKYFAVSRRALNVPSIERIDDRALDILCGNHAPLPLASFFSRIGMDLSAHEAAVRDCGLSLDTTVDSREDRARLRALFASLEEHVLEAMRPERSLLLDYCAANGVFDAADITVVDIGWGGSLQMSIATLLRGIGRVPRLHGYYVSTDERIEKHPPAVGDIASWFCHAGRPWAMQKIVSQGYWMLEMAFSAPHGTVLGYERDGDAVVPVFHEFDPDSVPAQASRVFQGHGFAFAQRWCAIFDGMGPEVGSARAFRRFACAVQEPSVSLARFFGDVVHVGGLGVSPEDGCVAKPPTLRRVLRDPRAFRDAYRYSHWKRGFLTRVLGSDGVRVVARLASLVRTVKRTSIRLGSTPARSIASLGK